MSIAAEAGSAVRDGESRAFAGVRRPLRCGNCGYEIVVAGSQPPCPMCRDMSWEPAPWRRLSPIRG